MRLGICNFVFPRINAAAVSDVLALCDVIDFAPTVHGFRWPQACPPVNRLFSKPVRISCLQSIFFGVAEASLVRCELAFEAMSTHVQTVCRWGRRLDAEGLVFGAPSLRSGGTQQQAVVESRLLNLHEQVERHGLRLYLEAVSPRFGTEFIPSSADLLSLISRVPRLHLHLDVGQMVEEGQNPMQVLTTYRERLGHLHLSVPDLGMPSPDMVSLWKEILRLMKGSTISVVVEVQNLNHTQSADLVDLMMELRATVE